MEEQFLKEIGETQYHPGRGIDLVFVRIDYNIEKDIV